MSVFFLKILLYIQQFKVYVNETISATEKNINAIKASTENDIAGLRLGQRKLENEVSNVKLKVSITLTYITIVINCFLCYLGRPC